MSNPLQPRQMDLRTVAVLSWQLLTLAERRRVMVLAVGMTINGMLQTFSLALLVPFVGLMLDPSLIAQGGRLAQLSQLFGSPPPQLFMVGCAIALLAAIVLKNAFDFAYNHFLNRLVASVEQRVSVDLLSRCLHAPYEWYLSQNTGMLINAVMGDVVTWGRSGLKSILTLASATVMLLSIIVLLVGISPSFGMGLVMLGLILNVATMRLLKPFVKRIAALKHKASNEAYKVLNQSLSGVKDIQINGRESFFLKRFSDWQKQYVLASARLTTSQPVSGYAVEVLVAVILVAVGLAVSADVSLRHELSTVMAVYGVAIVRLVPVFNQFSATLNSVHGSVPAVQNILRTVGEIDRLGGSCSSAQEMPQDWTRLDIKSLTYRYPGVDVDALSEVSVQIIRGERIGLVGHSGSGKTTFVDLLSGLLEGGGGRIGVGEELLKRENAASWRAQVGYVSQHPFIADGSLRFNVALESDPTLIDEQRVVASLEAANLWEFVLDRLPERLDTELGERGIRFSGGQRQRVAIARALYRSPTLLILDEATSALDVSSESIVSASLGRISRETTMVIVAHRLSTVRDCDRILVLDKGRVIGFDSHERLIDICELYRELVKLGDLSN